MSERIATKCPACHSSTLMIGDGNWLVCSLIGCPDPTRINSIGDRTDSHFDDLQTLRDERDRLREALERVLEQWVNGRRVRDGISVEVLVACKAALMPAGQRLTPNEATE